MTIDVVNTAHGFVCATDDDLEKKKKLKLNEVYQFKYSLYRNYEFHKKFFALINIGWEYMSEKQATYFNHSIDGFRESMTISAGFYNQTYNFTKNEWTQTAKSIKFDKMSEEEFQDLYNKVKDVIFSIIQHKLTKDEYERNFKNF